MTYADTSVVVAFYLPERHTGAVQAGVRDNPGQWITPLHRAEWAHAVGQHVLRRQISTREAKAVAGAFAEDCRRGVWAPVELPDEAFDTCVRLANEYSATLAIRTLDSLHVASALELGADRFWTLDRRQCQLAEAAGLAVDR